MNTKHFPDIELCKRLTEAKFPKTERWRRDDIIFYSYEESDYVCPSIAELLDKLPCLTWYAWIAIEKLTTDYVVSYRINSNHDAQRIVNESLPNALAEMWLWLKKK